MDYSMQEILNKFAYCDKFSLTAKSNITEIPSKFKETLLKNHLNETKQELKNNYGKAIDNNKNLPNFDILFEEIASECESFYKNIAGKDILELCKKNISPFICDNVGKTTKYSEPKNIIWHFYHNIQHAFMSNDNLKNMPSTESFDKDKIFINDSDKVLKDNLLDFEYTYQTHCTAGPLQLALYFPLNAETKAWLLKFKNDYDLWNSDFMDLAIYNGQKLEFSSCTHEGFNSLDSVYTV